MPKSVSHSIKFLLVSCHYKLYLDESFHFVHQQYPGRKCHTAVRDRSEGMAVTPKGAKASAINYSLIETAKANGLEPDAYMLQVLKAITRLKSSRPC
jgi:hypothetical protein